VSQLQHDQILPQVFVVTCVFGDPVWVHAKWGQLDRRLPQRLRQLE
jgi:hypothetical protein